MSKQKKWIKQARFLKRKEDRLALSKYFAPGVDTRAQRMALQRVHLLDRIAGIRNDFSGPLPNWRYLLTCCARNGRERNQRKAWIERVEEKEFDMRR